MANCRENFSVMPVFSDLTSANTAVPVEVIVNRFVFRNLVFVRNASTALYSRMYLQSGNLKRLLQKASLRRESFRGKAQIFAARTLAHSDISLGVNCAGGSDGGAFWMWR